ncbi:MAG TPA: peroxiredoxin family protein [Bacteroidia bacterium]|nr:peroxiredoxin family protein [Bacteroidia bacterium]
MISRFGFVSLLLASTAICLSLFVTGIPIWIAPAVVVAGWVSAAIGVKITSLISDFIFSVAALLAMGFVLDHLAGSMPLFTLLSIAITIILLARPAFLPSFGYLKYAWLEPLAFIAAVSLYVMANKSGNAGWAGWAFPAPALGFALINTMGAVADYFSFSKAAPKEFIASEGTVAPLFILPDNEGKAVSLAGFRGKQHVLLLFVRGDWCPTCHIMLRVYEKHCEKFREKNIMLLAIGPDLVGVNSEMVKKLGLDYRILADDQLVALKAYGVQSQENRAGQLFNPGIPMPAAILVDKAGIVRYISRADRANDFLNPMQIFDVVAKLDA